MHAGSVVARRADPASQSLWHELEHVAQFPEPLAPRLLAPLARYLDSEHAMAYAFRLGDAGLDLDYYVVHGAGIEGWPRDFGAIFRREPRGFIKYDPLRPERAQRNRAVVVRAREVAAALDRATSPYRELGRRYPIALKADQLRVLVCDGPLLLAWVGAVRTCAYEDEHRARLQRLVVPLRRRLLAELRLGIDGTRAALGVAMERLGSPAFIVRGDGSVAHANAAGRALRDVDGGVGDALRRLQDAASPAWTVARVHGRGLPDHRLAIRNRPGVDLAPRVAALQARWRLTDREADVVLAVARGRSNKEIAAALGCAESTVEAHLTAVYQRICCSGRGALGALVYAS